MQAEKDDLQNSFKILRDHFRNQLIKYFEGIQTTKNLVVEQSLIGVIQHLLAPLPDSTRVLGYGSLIGYKVSQNFDLTVFQKMTMGDCKSVIYIIRPDLESV